MDVPALGEIGGGGGVAGGGGGGGSGGGFFRIRAVSNNVYKMASEEDWRVEKFKARECCIIGHSLLFKSCLQSIMSRGLGLGCPNNVHRVLFKRCHLQVNGCLLRLICGGNQHVMLLLGA